jgi:hypothetical protein
MALALAVRTSGYGCMTHGHQLAAKLAEGGGQWVLVEAFDEDGDGDEMWLTRTVPAPPLHDECYRRMTKQTTLTSQKA